jgi:hypothetical protein
LVLGAAVHSPSSNNDLTGGLSCSKSAPCSRPSEHDRASGAVALLGLKETPGDWRHGNRFVSRTKLKPTLKPFLLGERCANWSVLDLLGLKGIPLGQSLKGSNNLQDWILAPSNYLLRQHAVLCALVSALRAIAHGASLPTWIRIYWT